MRLLLVLTRGLFLILTGILSLFQGNPVGGIWLFLIGMFIRGASQMSYQQVLLQKMLEGETVRRFLRENPVTVPASASISQVLEDYFLKYHYKMFPVTEEDALRGCVVMDRARNVPREQRETKKVGELLQQCSAENTISPSLDAMGHFRALFCGCKIP